MAIKKTYIGISSGGSSLEAVNNLYNYLSEYAVPEYFTSVTKTTDSETTTYPYVSCFVGNTELIRIYNGNICYSDRGVVVQTDSGAKITTRATFTTQLVFAYAIRSEKGISLRTSSYPFAFTITKDDNRNTTVIFAENLSLAPASSAVVNLYAVNTNTKNISPVRLGFYSCPDYVITSLAPIVVSGEDGNYTPDAFLVLFPDNTTEGCMDIDGEKYMTNGLWCVKD